MFVPTNSFDVVPSIGLMAEKALRHVSVLYSRNLHRHHLEVHHVVARWSLVALRTIHRQRRRMAKLPDRPSACPVTVGAVRSEQRTVRILVRVAGCAVERGLFGLDVRMRNLSTGKAVAIRAREQSRLGAHESEMIHEHGPMFGPHVFDVATPAVPDRRVKGRSLLSEQALVVGVASYAARSADTVVRSVARVTVCHEGRMRAGERTGIDDLLPEGKRSGALRMARIGDGERRAQCAESYGRI